MTLLFGSDVSVWGPGLIAALAALAVAYKGLRSDRREERSALVRDMAVVLEEQVEAVARHRKAAEVLRELNAELIATGESDRKKRKKLHAEIANCRQLLDEHASTCAVLRSELQELRQRD